MPECRPPKLFVWSLLVALLALPAPAFSAKHKLDKALQKAQAQGESGPVRVIITSTNPGAVRDKLTAKGKMIVAEHGTINAITTIVDSSDLKDLANDPGVVSVSLDAVVRSHQSASGNDDALVGLDLVRSIVGASSTGLTGNGVG